MILVAQVFLAWLLADFLSGAFHFIEDRILSGTQKSKFLQGVVNDNMIHHMTPSNIVRETWIGNMSTTMPITLPIAVLFLVIQDWTSLGFLTALFLTFGNLIHRFSHDPYIRDNLFITTMQSLYLFCPTRQHNEHHFKDRKVVARPDSRVRYCVMTGLLNPVLDSIRFWDAMFWIYRRF